MCQNCGSDESIDLSQDILCIRSWIIENDEYWKMRFLLARFVIKKIKNEIINKKQQKSIINE